MYMKNNERICHETSSKGIQEALDTLAARRPALATLVTAFGPLLVAKAKFKESLPVPEAKKEDFPDFDPVRFSQGAPLFTLTGLMDFHPELKQAARMILPPMAEAFAGIKDDVERLEEKIEDDSIAPEDCVKAFVDDDTKKIDDLAARAGIPSEVFKFALAQMAEPFMEVQAKALSFLIEDHQWLHGYCPICGSFAAVAGLIGEGGKRWLQCPCCAHEWRFNRNACPKCDNKDHDSLEYFFDQNGPVREGERVNVCNACKSYLLTVDLRQHIDPVNMDVAAMGMIGLDIQAREKGYSPLAATFWNSLD